MFGVRNHGVLALLVLACGSNDAPAVANTDGGAASSTTSTAATTGSSGATSTGSSGATGAGVGGAGTTGVGGASGGGGATSTGGTGGAAGSPRDASNDAPAMCFGDGGRIVHAAKACTGSDSECFLLHVVTCCGPDLAIGLAKNASEYAACYQQAIGPDACKGLGCAKDLSTVDEDGQTTAGGGAHVARCMNLVGGPECRTQVTFPPGSGDH